MTNPLKLLNLLGAVMTGISSHRGTKLVLYHLRIKLSSVSISAFEKQSALLKLHNKITPQQNYAVSVFRTNNTDEEYMLSMVVFWVVTSCGLINWYNPEDNHRHLHHCENLKSHTKIYVILS
jgi:hypothetical protein